MLMIMAIKVNEVFYSLFKIFFGYSSNYFVGNLEMWDYAGFEFLGD